MLNGIVNVVNSIDAPSKNILPNIPENQFDGELLLEDYYLDEAFQFGKKTIQPIHPKHRNI